jgi:hypothetical protein
LIDRSLDLTLSPGTHGMNLRLFRRLRNDVVFLQTVREIRVCDWMGSGVVPTSSAKIEEWLRRGVWPEDGSRDENTWMQIQQLNELIPRMSLMTFTWAFSFSFFSFPSQLLFNSPHASH